MTSLQKTAKSTQAWPLINIVRQVLKSCGYTMSPKRLSNGYNKSGKKLYRRVLSANQVYYQLLSLKRNNLISI